jgi:hypothetical protein
MGSYMLSPCLWPDLYTTLENSSSLGHLSKPISRDCIPLQLLEMALTAETNKRLTKKLLKNGNKMSIVALESSEINLEGNENVYNTAVITRQKFKSLIISSTNN